MTESEAIPIRTLRNEIASIIKRVEAGESFDITRHGHRVARITPSLPVKRLGTLADLWELRERVPADPAWAAEIRHRRDEDVMRDPYGDAKS